MPLFTRELKEGCQRSATPDLNHIAHLIWASWLTNQANGHRLVIVVHILQQRCGTIDSIRFFVASNGNDQRTVRWRFFDKINRGSSKRSNARFHVSGTASIHDAIFDFRTKWGHGPCRLIPKRNNVSVTIKAKSLRVPFFAPTSEQIPYSTTVCPAQFKARIAQ